MRFYQCYLEEIIRDEDHSFVLAGLKSGDSPILVIQAAIFGKFSVLTVCNTSTQDIQQGQTLRGKCAILALLTCYSLVPQVEAETFAKQSRVI